MLIRDVANGVGNHVAVFHGRVDAEILVPIFAEAVHPGIGLDVGVVSAVGTQSDIVLVGPIAVFEQRYEFMLRPI